MYGWETEEEEDIWEFSLDQICLEAEEYEHSSLDPEMTIGELMEWRYLRAELEKEQVTTFNLILVKHANTFPCALLMCREMPLSSKANTKKRLSDTS